MPGLDSYLGLRLVEPRPRTASNSRGTCGPSSPSRTASCTAGRTAPPSSRRRAWARRSGTASRSRTVAWSGSATRPTSTAPSPRATLTAVASPVHRGRSQQVWRVDITDESGPAGRPGPGTTAEPDGLPPGSESSASLDGQGDPCVISNVPHPGRRVTRPRAAPSRPRARPAPTSASCCRRPAWSPSTRASPTPRRAPRRSPTSTATPASCATAATRSTSWPKESTFLETSYLLIYGELPTADAAGRVRGTDPPAHAAARGPQAVLRRLPARRAPDAGAVARRCRRCRPSTRTRWTPSTRPTSSCRPSGCWPSCRRSPPTPTRSRSASRSSTRTTRSAWSRTSCG